MTTTTNTNTTNIVATTISIDPRLLAAGEPHATRRARTAIPAGLESAIEAGLVTDAASAQRWIGDVLEHSVLRMEAPHAAAG